MRAVLATITAAVLAGSGNAQICRTNNCRTVQRVVEVPTAVVEATPSIFVINNVPAIPAGVSDYRSGTYPQISLVDADRLAAQALLLQRSAGESQREYHRATLDFLARIVEIQRPIAETLAKGQAAREVLAAAGLQRSVAALDVAERGIQPNLAQQHCAKCHTGDEAKSGFRLDRDFDATKALQAVASKQMPPDGLPPDTRLQLITELLGSARLGTNPEE